MSAVVKRARSFGFDRRYAPIDDADGNMVRSWDDAEVLEAFDSGRFDLVWTLVEGDTCEVVSIPGFAR
jgi:hypothetical protein